MESNHPSTSRTPQAPGSKSTLASSLVFITILVLLAAATIWLFKTNPAAGTWAQGYNPTGHWWISTIFAALPIFVLLGAMAVFGSKPMLRRSPA